MLTCRGICGSRPADLQHTGGQLLRKLGSHLCLPVKKGLPKLNDLQSHLMQGGVLVSVSPLSHLQLLR